MTARLKEKIGERNRRQRTHANELRHDGLLHHHARRFFAEQKLQRSRKRLAQQVTRSRQMALRAKQKAIRSRERARARR